MKQTIEQWLNEFTTYSHTNIGGVRIDFLYMKLGELGINDARTKEEAVSKLASLLAAHIENSKNGH